MATPYVQGATPLLVDTPFGPDKLILRSFEGQERMSGLFRYTLELASTDPELDFSTVVGKRITLTLALDSGDKQYVNGVVGRFCQAGTDGRFTIYYADLHPWLWLLGMCSNCHIHQDVTAPEILAEIFLEHGFTDFKDRLEGSYKKREYCVQYNESTLAFVSRLMEEEGIFYFFEHDASSHNLVLADSATPYGACPGLPKAVISKLSGSAQADNQVLDFRIEHLVVAGKYKLSDYNFLTPTTDLLATSSGESEAAEREQYYYPGKYAEKSEGEARANLRLTALETDKVRALGTSTCRAFHAGCQFLLDGHTRADLNTNYVLLSVTHSGDQNRYSNSFEAFPADQAFRPPLLTPRPFVGGCQTATVVGKEGDEMLTDQYGRIKVKFHWDQRKEAENEKRSCWIRVAQTWAGQGWGSLFLPRVKQEVVVSFEDGDPDRPLITGSVYNAQQTVPYAQPDAQTRSTIKTQSFSPQADGFNEIRFEDKSGSEELFVQAQKDMTVSVLNDQNITVKQNRKVTVQEKDETLVVDKGNRAIQVNTGNETHTVKGKRDLTITGAESHTCSADFTHSVSGNYTLKVSGNLSIEVNGSVLIKSGTDFTNQAGTTLDNKAGTALTNTSGTALTNKAGTSMSNEAQVSIESKASASHTVESSGVLNVKGAMVKIN